MRLYLVSWHLGGHSWSTEEIESYCDTCGDIDTTVLSYDEDDPDVFGLLCRMAEYTDPREALELIAEIGKFDRLLEQLKELQTRMEKRLLDEIGKEERHDQ